MTDRPQDVVRKGLEDRDWDCMCDPGSHESPCPFAALSALITERDRLREALKAAEPYVTDVPDVHRRIIVLSASPPEQEAT